MTKISSKRIEKEENQEKDKYRVTNWSSYNKSLIGRGDITLWIEESAVKSWYHQGPDQQGSQYVYSDKCIETLLGLKAVFSLAYRQLEGFSRSIINLMGLKVVVPCYTQISRRAKDLEIDLEVPKSKEPIYVVADSTGLKVFGEGEWKTRKHGISKRRIWRKIHLGVDDNTGFIHAQVLTENGKPDAQQVETMLDQIESPIDRFSGDGAYDKFDVWKILKERKIEGIIPPQRNAVYWLDENNERLDLDRNTILEEIKKTSRKEWKKKSNFHRRSLSETAMMRYKIIFGPTLYSKIFEKQQTETAIKIKCLNKMTALGMPVSIKIVV